MDMSQYRDLFLTETREHINNLNKLVVTLEGREEEFGHGLSDVYRQRCDKSSNSWVG